MKQYKNNHTGEIVKAEPMISTEYIALISLNKDTKLKFAPISHRHFGTNGYDGYHVVHDFGTIDERHYWISGDLARDNLSLIHSALLGDTENKSTTSHSQKEHDKKPFEAPAGKQLLFPIFQYFKYEHLPEHLKEVSRPFCILAAKMIYESTPEGGPETSAGLRKLLEAKDCAVRAALANRTHYHAASEEPVKSATVELDWLNKQKCCAGDCDEPCVEADDMDNAYCAGHLYLLRDE